MFLQKSGSEVMRTVLLISMSMTLVLSSGSDEDKLTEAMLRRKGVLRTDFYEKIPPPTKILQFYKLLIIFAITVCVGHQ